MANLNKKRMLFFTTSPRTPFKMIPEIELLGNNFGDKEWNKATQVAFTELLSKEGWLNTRKKQEKKPIVCLLLLRLMKPVLPISLCCIK